MEYTTLYKKPFIRTLLFALAYGLTLYFIQIFLFKAGLVNNVPDAKTLLRYDADIYHDIMEKGYYYPNDGVNNTGFYILFPWLWKVLHVGVEAISMVNILLFATGFAIVCQIYKVSTMEKFLWLTTPSLYFMAVPYSEALFCVLTTLSFYGIVSEKRWLIWVSLFLLSLTRATAIFMIPSLLIMELLTNDRQTILKTAGRYLVTYATPTILGLAAFVLYQYWQTGVWFAYFKQQQKYLGHEWAIPKLPFSNFYGGQKVIWLGGLAMFVCFVALLLLIKFSYKWLVQNHKVQDKLWALTLGYLPVVLLSLVFCNPTWGSNTTNILGIHRYTLCTPFIFVFLYHMASGIKQYMNNHFIIAFILCNIVWLLMGSYSHLQNMLFWNFVTLLVVCYMLHNNKKQEWASYALIGINILMQVALYQQFLSGQFTD